MMLGIPGGTRFRRCGRGRLLHLQRSPEPSPPAGLDSLLAPQAVLLLDVDFILSASFLEELRSPGAYDSLISHLHQHRLLVIPAFETNTDEEDGEILAKSLVAGASPHQWNMCRGCNGRPSFAWSPGCRPHHSFRAIRAAKEPSVAPFPLAVTNFYQRARMLRWTRFCQTRQMSSRGGGFLQAMPLIRPWSGSIAAKSSARNTQRTTSHMW